MAWAIGFDFCEFLWRLMPAAEREKLESQANQAAFSPGPWQSFARTQHDAKIDRARL